MKKYRLTLPCDFLDDTGIHPAGDVVELTAEQALLYKHALIEVEEKK